MTFWITERFTSCLTKKNNLVLNLCIFCLSVLSCKSRSRFKAHDFSWYINENASRFLFNCYSLLSVTGSHDSMNVNSLCLPLLWHSGQSTSGNPKLLNTRHCGPQTASAEESHDSRLSLCESAWSLLNRLTISYPCFYARIYPCFAVNSISWHTECSSN